ncbi:unnamed protein product [Schistocephalus solidus]|uniref:DUF4821 domain-containing protein n=1 Tax=Schistocephalus solidus TaxID=70667 RepID=A0A183TDX1_SCHSO|nr:unnamed protein product [Schistocephalus solidus]
MMDVAPCSDASPETPSSNEEETPIESLPDISIDNEFPIDSLNAMHKTLHCIQWQVPVLPGGDLERVLRACIHLFNKAVELCAITADKDIPEILELESIILDPKSIFHLHSVRDCTVLNAIQMGEPNDSFENFPKITSLLPHLSADLDEAAEEQEEESATDSASDSSVLLLYARSPEGRPLPLLEDFINLFGRLGGFDAVRDRFLSTPEKPMNVGLIYAYLKPFHLSCDYISSGIINHYLLPICGESTGRSYVGVDEDEDAAAAADGGGGGGEDCRGHITECRRSLRSIQQCRQDDSVVHLEFCAEVNAMSIPDDVLQASEGLAGFGDPVGDFFIDFGASG